MTAHELVESIFSRAQGTAPANLRRVTQLQFDYLLKLVRQEKEGEIRNGQGGSIVWMPAPGVRYVLTAPAPGAKTGTLVKLKSTAPTGMDSLF